MPVVGDGSPNFADQHIRCTRFNGKTWRISTSPGGSDWGYDD